MENPLVTIYYKTANGKQICVEVSTAVKELLEQSDRQIRTQRRQDRRHRDDGNFTGDLTNASMRFLYQMDTADLVMEMERNERLRDALNQISHIQRRRILLYYMTGLSHKEIAVVEGVNQSNISRSITAALEKLQTYLTD